MKHIYLSTDDIGDGLSVLDGKVKVSENYLTVAQSDAKYQASGTYATSEELTAVDAKVDGLVDVYQPLGNYITIEDADLKYLTSDSLVDFATKEYVDQAIAGIDTGGGGATTPGFDGTYVGESTFTGNMTIAGELTVDSLYDTTGTRQILLSDIVTTSDLNDILPGLGGGGTPSDYTLPAATTTTLGGIIVGTGLTVDADGVLSVIPQTGEGGEVIVPSDYVLPVSTASVLGGVKIGENINVAEDGTISVTFPTVEDVVIPIASTSTVGVVKVGNNLSITPDGTLSATSTGFDGTYDGEVVFNGNLTVNGDIVYSGELMAAGSMPPLEYRGLKALFECGRFVQGAPITAGEITYNEDGTFTDGADYSGKMTAEGYLDLSVQNKIITSLQNCNITGTNRNCIVYVEIVGKLSNGNSIFAAFAKKDKTTSDTFAGTKNNISSQAIGERMVDGINKLLFVPTSGGKGKIFLNGEMIGTDGQYALLQAISNTATTEIMLGYSWAAGGTGLLKKVALINYTDYGYSGDSDGIEISARGFKDTPAPTRNMLRAENEISNLKHEIAELRELITGKKNQSESPNPQTKPMTVFKRRT